MCFGSKLHVRLSRCLFSLLSIPRIRLSAHGVSIWCVLGAVGVFLQRCPFVCIVNRHYAVELRVDLVFPQHLQYCSGSMYSSLRHTAVALRVSTCSPSVWMSIEARRVKGRIKIMNALRFQNFKSGRSRQAVDRCHIFLMHRMCSCTHHVSTAVTMEQWASYACLHQTAIGSLV